MRRTGRCAVLIVFKWDLCKVQPVSVSCGTNRRNKCILLSGAGHLSPNFHSRFAFPVAHRRSFPCLHGHPILDVSHRTYSIKVLFTVTIELLRPKSESSSMSWRMCSSAASPGRRRPRLNPGTTVLSPLDFSSRPLIALESTKTSSSPPGQKGT